MDFLFNNEYLLIFLSFAAILIIFFIIFYLFFSKKIKEEKFVILKISQEFEESLRKTTEEELRKIIAELKEKVNNFSDKTILNYEKDLSEFVKKIEDEFIALSLLSKEGREKILKNSEEKSKKLENQITGEISKFSELNNQIRNFIIEAVRKEVEVMGKNLNAETKIILKTVDDIVTKKIIEMERNIDEYQRKKMAEVDKKIYQLIGKVAKMTIGKSLDLATHEELVMESLEKAKRESFFK